MRIKHLNLVDNSNWFAHSTGERCHRCVASVKRNVTLILVRVNRALLQSVKRCTPLFFIEIELETVIVLPQLGQFGQKNIWENEFIGSQSIQMAKRVLVGEILPGANITSILYRIWLCFCFSLFLSEECWKSVPIHSAGHLWYRTCIQAAESLSKVLLWMARRTNARSLYSKDRQICTQWRNWRSATGSKCTSSTEISKGIWQVPVGRRRHHQRLLQEQTHRAKISTLLDSATQTNSRL